MYSYKIDENIVLRPFFEDDAEDFYQLIVNTKDYLKEWLGWLDDVKSVENIHTTIEKRLKETSENNGHPLSFVIIYKNKIAGTIGFNSIDRKNNIGVVGYWIGKYYQGKGIMSKTFETILDYGFTKLSLNRIEVRIASENKKSKAIAHRFDFQREGIMREAEWLYDHYVDHVLYSLLATDWKYAKNIKPDKE